MTNVKKTLQAGTIIECCEKSSIEKACLEENLRRFTQAHNTTFASEPVRQHLDSLGMNATAQSILNGQPTLIPLSEDQHKFVKGLKTPQKVKEGNQISNWISQKKWKSCWKTQKEDTSSGPSGLHFGHFKANSQDEDLCFIDSSLASIPYATGYSPTRWCHGTNVMLYKKQTITTWES